MSHEPGVTPVDSALGPYDLPAGMRGTPGPLLSLVKDQRIAFVIVGGANTVIGFAFYWLYLRVGIGYIGALILAHICAVIWAFLLYRNLVFRVRGHLFLDLWRFEVVNLSALGINLALLPVAVEVIHLRPLLAQLAVASITMFVSFFGHRDFSFRRRRAKKAGAEANQPAELA